MKRGRVRGMGAWVVAVQGGAGGHLGRWLDPVTGRRRELLLERVGLDTALDREAWLERKVEELRAARRVAILTGSPAVAAVPLATGIAEYLADCRGRALEAKTVEIYGAALADLRAWLEGRGRRHLQSITPDDLLRYRAGLIRLPQAPRTKNGRLGSLSSALGWWRRQRWLSPAVGRDVIEDACLRLKVPPATVIPLPAPAIRRLLAACAAVEPDPLGVRPRHDAAIAGAHVALALLTGMRRGELDQLRRDQVDLEAAPGGELRLPPEVTKTGTGRVIDLAVSPGARELLRALLALPDDGSGTVWGAVISRQVTKPWKRRLQLGPAKGPRGVVLPPVEWTYQRLRQTCGSWLTCAPGIFGGASAFRSARQLGHSVAVAERHYLGVLREIPPAATTLDGALGIAAELRAIIDRVKALAPG